VNTRQTRRLAVIIAATTFTLLALMSALQIYLTRRAFHEPGTLSAALAMGAAVWGTWALFTPGIVALGRRWNFDTGHRVVSTFVHGAALAGCHIVNAWCTTWLSSLLYEPTKMPTVAQAWRATLTSSRQQLALFVYAAILGLDRALQMWRALEERELQASRLEAQTTRARLEALATRLQPHFLFNALHAIGALIDENPRLARTVVAELGDLLRDVLAEPQEIEISLKEELALLRRYLGIEQMRFSDRLRTEIIVPDDLLSLRVPRLLLQPLVENGLRHGIAPRGVGGSLRLEASRVGDRLRLGIWNDGAPLAAAHSEGLGLKTTRERLGTRYGGSATLLLRSAPGGGVETVVELPVVEGAP
jgi:hypothetical protein